MIFFTGCTHFGHANIIKLTNRPFDTVEEMDAALITNWNATVGDDDVVYHVGDVAFGADYRNWTRHLKGTIHYLRGNHDKQGEHWVSMWTLKNVDVVGKVIMCHYPIEEWDGWWRGSIHVHAHTHGKELVSAPRRFNVGVDANNFRPVSLAALLAHPNATAGVGAR
jgi:calcineurin-like phosphoesterase family protein